MSRLYFVNTADSCLSLDYSPTYARHTMRTYENKSPEWYTKLPTTRRFISAQDYIQSCAMPKEMRRQYLEERVTTVEFGYSYMI